MRLHLGATFGAASIAAVAMIVGALVGTAPANADDSLVLTVDPNVPTSLRDAIDAAYAAGYRNLVVPEGAYDVGPKGAESVNLLVNNMHDLVIDATGAVLNFQNRTLQGIRFQASSGITFRGATLQNEIVPFTQGTVTAATDTSLDVQIDQGYPVNLLDTRYFHASPSGYTFDPVTLMAKDNAQDLYFSSRTETSPGQFHLTFASPRAGVEVGDLLLIKGTGSKLLTVYDSTAMILEYLTLHNGAAFGINNELGGGNTYRHIDITRGMPPAGATRAPLVSTARDGFHSDETRGGPYIDDLTVEHAGDDGIAVHGSYWRVVSASGTSVVVGRLAAYTWFAPFVAGDQVEATTKDGRVNVRTKVVSAAPVTCPNNTYNVNACTTLVLDVDPALVVGDRVGNMDAYGQGFVIENSTILDTRARGLLIKAGGRVENNTVTHAGIGGIVAGPELIWLTAGEAGYVTGLTISGNVIEDTGARLIMSGGTSELGAISVHGESNPPSTEGLSPLARGNIDVVIENNVIRDVHQIPVQLDAIAGARVLGNVVEHAFSRPNDPIWADPYPSSPSSTFPLSEHFNSGILLSRATDVTFEDNVVCESGAFLLRDIAIDDTSDVDLATVQLGVESRDHCGSGAADSETAPPAVADLASTSGWAYGLHDGNFDIRMDLWWGTNASMVELYENGMLVATRELSLATPGAQSAVFEIRGRANGTYLYEAQLSNSKGITASHPVTVDVTDALPGKPAISRTYQESSSFTLTANLWWGTNATYYRFLEGGSVIGEGQLTAATPYPQSASVTIAGASAGQHEYRVEFENDVGITTSETYVTTVVP
jgi:hypothetical protein